LTAFIDTCDPINTTGMSHLKVTYGVSSLDVQNHSENEFIQGK